MKTKQNGYEKLGENENILLEENDVDVIAEMQDCVTDSYHLYSIGDIKISDESITVTFKRRIHRQF